MLKAPLEKLLNRELFVEFCEEFTREMNRLRMERRARLSSGKREVERISTRIKPPPLLHPEMAKLYRYKVPMLAQAWSTRRCARKPPMRSEDLSTASS